MNGPPGHRQDHAAAGPGRRDRRYPGRAPRGTAESGRGFRPRRQGRPAARSRRHAVTPLNPALTGLEIVVASANNGAVENITAEIPGPGGIGAQWREAAARLDYFTATARLVHGDGAWAMVAARLGNAANRRAFTEKFWWGAPGHQDGRMVDLLGRAAVRPVSWGAAREEFRTAREKVRLLAAERTEVALAQVPSSWPATGRGDGYASISGAEDTLGALAGQRVDAERSLRAACHRHQAAAKALDAHARAKPGLRASLSTRFGARQEWRATARRARCRAPRPRRVRQHRSAGDHGSPGPVRRGGSRTRAESAAALRRLTAECAAAQEVIARGRQRWGEHFPEGPGFPGAGHADAAAGTAEARRELTAPWADPEFAAARTELFLAALALHKALITAQARRVRGNLNALVDFLSGKSRPGNRDLLAAWQTLFLVVPVISTTFASVPAMFGGLGQESVGWLLIDEAGQAPAPAGGRGDLAGEADRGRRRSHATRAGGDACRGAGSRHCCGSSAWPRSGHRPAPRYSGSPTGSRVTARCCPTPRRQAEFPRAGARGLTEERRPRDKAALGRAEASGTAAVALASPADRGVTWVGTPLRVHRRSDRPMFEISNETAYDGLMVFGTRDRDPFPGRDRWFDVRSGMLAGTGSRPRASSSARSFTSCSPTGSKHPGSAY